MARRARRGAKKTGARPKKRRAPVVSVPSPVKLSGEISRIQVDEYFHVRLEFVPGRSRVILTRDECVSVLLPDLVFATLHLGDKRSDSFRKLCVAVADDITDSDTAVRPLSSGHLHVVDESLGEICIGTAKRMARTSGADAFMLSGFPMLEYSLFLHDLIPGSPRQFSREIAREFNKSSYPEPIPMFGWLSLIANSNY